MTPANGEGNFDGVGTWSHEALLRAMIEQAPGMTCLALAPDLVCLHANRAWVETLGIDVIGRSIRESFAGTLALEVVERVLASGIAETFSGTPLMLPDSEPTRFFNRSYVPLKDDNGNVQAVYVSAYEVTADVKHRWQQEANMQRSRAELERTFLLIDEVPVLIGVLDPPDLKLSLANRAMRQLLGDPMIGASARDVIPPQSMMLPTLDRVYTSKRTESFEITSTMANFAGRSFSVSLVPVLDCEGAVAHIMVAATEITEQRRGRQELEAQARDLELARQQAVAAGRAKDEFLAMLSHELRNPLQPMLTAVQVMRLDGDKSPALDMLEREVAYLTRLVDDLLDISRISRGVISLKLERVDMRTIIQRGLELASPLLEERAHRVSTELQAHNLGVRGDSQRLAQVISNLIQNAAKYSARGSHIRIAVQRADERVVLRISDDGVGIAPDMLRSIFEAFVQGDQPLARSSGGLGIGLAIVKSLVEAHGGVVSAHSDGLGKGSTFVVELPWIELAPALEEANIVQRIRRMDATRMALRILVVDDNVEAADILKIGLGAIGHHISIANDGPTALELVKTEPPQIALLDIGLPVMDGYELGRLLRAALDIPIVAITGYGQPIDRERSHAAGFAAHLVKPVDLGELAELVDTLAGAAKRDR